MKSKNLIVTALLSVLAIIALFFIYQKLNPKILPENLIEGTGRIDGDLILLNTKYPGRVKEINAEEGSSVKKGDVLARLKSEEMEARLEQAAAHALAVQKELNAAQKEFEILKKSLPNSVEKSYQAQKIARSQIAELTSSIESLELILTQDEKDYLRFKKMFEKALLEKHKLELAKLKYENDLKKLDSLKLKREQARNNEKISLLDTKDAQISLLKIEVSQERIKAYEQKLKAAVAAEKEISAMIKEMALVSQIDGYVVDKTAHIGEVVGAGAAVVTLIDPKALYLKIFVDTMKNGKIKIADRAVIFLDAYPNRPIEAKVVRISQKAEFTPKEVSVRSDRIQRVYAVDLKPLQHDPLLKLGLPAVGIISIDAKGLPSSMEEIPSL